MFEVLVTIFMLYELVLLRLQGRWIDTLSKRIDVLSEELDLLTEDD